MAGKRGPTSELNHENWNRDDEPEEAGTFRTASEEELKKRVIKKARRKNDTPNGENKTIFSTFSGFKSTETATKASPFSFLANKTSEKKESNTEDDNSTSDDNNVENKLFNDELESFNKKFIDWVNNLMGKNPKRILTTYLEQYKKSLESVFSEEQIKRIKFDDEQFEYKDLKQNKKVEETDDKKPAPDSKDRLNVFSSIKFPAFSFGNVNTAVITGSSAPLFNFSDFKSSNFGNIETNVKIEHAEQPKNEFKPIVEENFIYSKRCKIFVKHDGNYSDRGVGTLYLKPIKDSEKIQLIVRADNSLGNILLNFILSEGLPSQRTGKNNVMIVCIPTPDSEQKPTSVLIRVKTEEDADEVLENINKYKK